MFLKFVLLLSCDGGGRNVTGEEIERLRILPATAIEIFCFVDSRYRARSAARSGTEAIMKREVARNGEGWRFNEAALLYLAGD